METILCGMNEVDSSKVKDEIQELAQVKASGMTGFEEKFKVLFNLYNFCTNRPTTHRGDKIFRK